MNNLTTNEAYEVKVRGATRSWFNFSLMCFLCLFVLNLFILSLSFILYSWTQVSCGWEKTTSWRVVRDKSSLPTTRSKKRKHPRPQKQMETEIKIKIEGSRDTIPRTQVARIWSTSSPPSRRTGSSCWTWRSTLAWSPASSAAVSAFSLSSLPFYSAGDTTRYFNTI